MTRVLLLREGGVARSDWVVGFFINHFLRSKAMFLLIFHNFVVDIILFMPTFELT
jgi:hypothetical protein